MTLAELPTTPTDTSGPAPAPGVAPIDRPAWLARIERRHVHIRVVLAVLDLAVVIAAGALAWEIAGTPGADRGQHMLAALLSLPLWMAAFWRYRLYQARVIATRWSEYRRLAKVVAIGLVSVIVVDSTHAAEALVRPWLVWLVVLTFGGLVLERELMRAVFRKRRMTGRYLRDVVIVGANEEAVELRRAIDADPGLGTRFAGHLAVDAGSTHPDAAADVIGSIDDASAVLSALEVSHVLIAASATQLRTTQLLARALLASGYHVEVSPTLPDIATARITVRPFGRFPVLYLESFDQSGWRARAKRVFDLVVASGVLLVAAPVMAAVAVAVRLDSKGPVVYRQERVGRGGEPFPLLKFRSMVTNAHEMRAELAARNEADGPLFKITDDPRITRVGRFIRRTSLDELPQLWNVIRGEMSLVGPRPALAEEVEHWDAALRDRLRVQPGITGLWQVSGRSSSSFDDYSRHDLYYVDNWSMARDIEILARTVPAVLAQRGAT
ncbi:MAG: sugar transferase [Actinomycetota bacterium]|nr:sugar transferase [Actinomycetota bacterium]